MKLVLVKNLNSEEILARDILDLDGKTLLKKGVVLNSRLVNTLIKHGIFYVYIYDENLSDISLDDKLFNLKRNTLEALPNLFNDMISYNDNSLNSSLKIIDELIDYVESDVNINLNLYEVKSYDDYTYNHSVDTCIMSIFLGSNLNLETEVLRNLALASLFHDIGKTSVPNYIVTKPGKLTTEEYKYMKLHPYFGKDILLKHKNLSLEVINGVLQHHEKFNGTGYPANLKEHNISLFARIISICDVYSAITSDRCYRKKFNPREGYELILSQSGTSFDPSMVQLFKSTFAIYPIGCAVLLSNNLVGYVVGQNKGLPDRPLIRIVQDPLCNKITPFEIDLKDNLNITISNSVSSY